MEEEKGTVKERRKDEIKGNRQRNMKRRKERERERERERIEKVKK